MAGPRKWHNQFIPKTDALQLAERREKMKAYLECFAQTGSIRLACLAGGISRNTHAYWLEKTRGENPDPQFSLEGEGGELVPFAALWDIAAETAADVLEEEVRRRSLHGVDEPVFGQLARVEYVESQSGGEREIVRKYTGVVGSKRVYSDVLLMFYLKGLRPATWRENVKLDVEHTGTVTIDDTSRSRLAEKLAAALDRSFPVPQPDEPKRLGEPVIDVELLTLEAPERAPVNSPSNQHDVEQPTPIDSIVRLPKS